jgi:hypothetical protein
MKPSRVHILGLADEGAPSFPRGQRIEQRGSLAWLSNILVAFDAIMQTSHLER